VETKGFSFIKGSGLTEMDGAFRKRKFRVRLKHKQTNKRMERDGESRAEMHRLETVRGESRKSSKLGARIGGANQILWIAEISMGRQTRNGAREIASLRNPVSR
jgi:hypothetical protein